MNKMEELEKQVELYEKNIESQQQSLETLKRELEQLKAEKENEPWKPKGGEFYWYIDDDVDSCTARWSGYSMHENRYAIGNAFRTNEEAEFRAEQLKVEAELRRFARPFIVDEKNYAIYFDHHINDIFIDCYFYTQGRNIQFASAEIAQKAIDTVGAERIKKYYFGIDE